MVYDDVLDDVLEQLCSICEESTRPSSKASGISPRIGFLPATGGVACYINSGYNEHTSLRKNTRCESITVLFNLKYTSQETALQVADTMHNALVGALSYASTSSYTIMNIESSALPNYVGREEEYFLYAFAVQVFINRKG